jgi:mannitol-1-phosphate/altronate dehydrogenase
MTNPFLHDRVERVIRDPARKLAWSDRIFGTMRMAMEAGIQPRAMALGAAAALDAAHAGEGGAARGFLTSLWGSEAAADERDRCLSLVAGAAGSLAAWRR